MSAYLSLHLFLPYPFIYLSISNLNDDHHTYIDETPAINGGHRRGSGKCCENVCNTTHLWIPFSNEIHHFSFSFYPMYSIFFGLSLLLPLTFTRLSTLHHLYSSSFILFIIYTLHHLYSSSFILFIIYTLHHLHSSSFILFIIYTLHHLYSSPFILFIIYTLHHLYSSSVDYCYQLFFFFFNRSIFYSLQVNRQREQFQCSLAFITLVLCCLQWQHWHYFATSHWIRVWLKFNCVSNDGESHSRTEESCGNILKALFDLSHLFLTSLL